MARLILLAVFLLSVTYAEISNKCKKTAKVFENIYERPTLMAPSSVCSMFPISCCSPETEMVMMQNTSSFGEVVFGRVNMKLRTLNNISADNSLTPIVFSEDFNNLIKGKEDLDIEALTKVALSYYIRNICTTDSFEPYADLVKAAKGPVKVIADDLQALYKGVETIKITLNAFSSYDVSDVCKTALIQNGIPANKQLKSTMCQLCMKDTFVLRTCINTCKNVVRGCVNDLTGIAHQLNNLAEALDRVYEFLLQHLYKTSGSLRAVEASVATTFSEDPDFKKQCYTNKPDTFVEKNYTAQLQSFSRAPLELFNIMESSTDYVCILAERRINYKCWTKTGITSNDTSVIAEFTTEGQTLNPVIPRPEKQGTAIQFAEDRLIKAATVANDALNTDEEEEEEEEVDSNETVGDDENVVDETDNNVDEEDKEEIDGEDKEEKDGEDKEEKDGEDKEEKDDADVGDGEYEVDGDNTGVEGASTSEKEKGVASSAMTVPFITLLFTSILLAA